MFRLKNIHLYVGGKHIVKGVDLKIEDGEVHTIMGPNGSGKSSLAYGLMGHPLYKIKNEELKIKDANQKSKILLNRKDITELSPDKRAREGLFLAFQHPISIPGVSVANFLRIAKNSLNEKETSRLTKVEELKSVVEFGKELRGKAQKLGIKEEFLQRSLNEDFSGGEKKKLEMLQLMTLEPKYAVIDEIDTGLDIDALKVVARGIKQVVKLNNTGILLITHYQRILHYVKPDFVHVMIDGRIVKSGSYNLAETVEKRGYKIF